MNLKDYNNIGHRLPLNEWRAPNTCLEKTTRMSGVPNSMRTIIIIFIIAVLAGMGLSVFLFCYLSCSLNDLRYLLQTVCDVTLFFISSSMGFRLFTFTHLCLISCKYNVSRLFINITRLIWAVKVYFYLGWSKWMAAINASRISLSILINKSHRHIRTEIRNATIIKCSVFGVSLPFIYTMASMPIRDPITRTCCAQGL